MEIARWLRTQWDRFAAAAAGLVGLTLIGLGWAGISRSTLVTQQIPYLASGGLFGIFFLGVSATLWLSADLRDEWRKLDDIHKAMESTAAGDQWTGIPATAMDDARDEESWGTAPPTTPPYPPSPIPPGTARRPGT